MPTYTRATRYELWFTLEVSRRNDIRRVYILEPSQYQYYRTFDLHESYHFQLRAITSVNEYTNILGSQGFVSIPSTDADSFSSRDEQFYTILSCDTDHFCPDISVVNCSEESELGCLILSMNLGGMASLMLDVNSSRQSSDDRGNYRRDIGFCPQAQMDTSVVEGMNAPYFTSKYDSMPGLEGDTSFAVSMMRAACILKTITEDISRTYDQGWNDFDDEERRSLFANRVAQSRGLEDYQDFVTEGNSIGITGIDQDGQMRILRRHVDSMNSRSPTHHFYWGVNVYQEVRHEGWDSTQMIRVSFGGYGKKCVDDFLRRLTVNRDIDQAFSDWRSENEGQFDSTAESILVWRGTMFRFLPPRVDKSVYYSIFVHGLLELGYATKYDRGILLEAVFAMCLTPSPSGWYNGIMHCLRIRRGSNLITTFIKFMTDSYGHVSHGEGRRRQVSHGREITEEQLFQSLVNMANLVDEANGKIKSRALLKKWAGTPQRGGVYGSGELIAHEQIHVLTLLGVVSHRRHVDRVTISRGTGTYRRLEAMGVESDSHRSEVVRYVGHRAGVEPWVVENGFCEWLRARRGNAGRYVDTIVRGQSLYFLRGDGVVEVDSSGVETTTRPRHWEWGRAVMEDGHLWWEGEFDPSLLDGVLQLTLKGDR